MSDINYQVGQTKHTIHNVGSPQSGTEIQAKGVKQLIERIEKENETRSTTEIVLDETNEVAFPGFPYKFEALGEKILVSIDVFKSGYECKECKGKKVILHICSCEKGGHRGLKYSSEDLDYIKASIGEDVALARESMVCGECNGVPESQKYEQECSKCKGLGALLHLPDNAKNLPTSGVVVSIGKECKNLHYKIGDRILFGPYAGSLIPTKAGLMFKVMDAHQAWCKITGGGDLAAFDFIILEGDK